MSTAYRPLLNNDIPNDLPVDVSTSRYGISEDALKGAWPTSKPSANTPLTTPSPISRRPSTTRRASTKPPPVSSNKNTLHSITHSVLSHHSSIDTRVNEIAGEHPRPFASKPVRHSGTSSSLSAINNELTTGRPLPGIATTVGTKATINTNFPSNVNNNKHIITSNLATAIITPQVTTTSFSSNSNTVITRHPNINTRTKNNNNANRNWPQGNNNALLNTRPGDQNRLQVGRPLSATNTQRPNSKRPDFSFHRIPYNTDYSSNNSNDGLSNVRHPLQNSNRDRNTQHLIIKSSEKYDSGTENRKDRNDPLFDPNRYAPAHPATNNKDKYHSLIFHRIPNIPDSVNSKNNKVSSSASDRWQNKRQFWLQPEDDTTADKRYQWITKEDLETNDARRPLTLKSDRFSPNILNSNRHTSGTDLRSNNYGSRENIRGTSILTDRRNIPNNRDTSIKTNNRHANRGSTHFGTTENTSASRYSPNTRGSSSTHGGIGTSNTRNDNRDPSSFMPSDYYAAFFNSYGKPADQRDTDNIASSERKNNINSIALFNTNFGIVSQYRENINDYGSGGAYVNSDGSFNNRVTATNKRRNNLHLQHTESNRDTLPRRNFVPIYTKFPDIMYDFPNKRRNKTRPFNSHGAFVATSTVSSTGFQPVGLGRPIFTTIRPHTINQHVPHSTNTAFNNLVDSTNSQLYKPLSASRNNCSHSSNALNNHHHHTSGVGAQSQSSTSGGFAGFLGGGGAGAGGGVSNSFVDHINQHFGPSSGFGGSGSGFGSGPSPSSGSSFGSGGNYFSNNFNNNNKNPYVNNNNDYGLNNEFISYPQEARFRSGKKKYFRPELPKLGFCLDSSYKLKSNTNPIINFTFKNCIIDSTKL